VGLTATKATRLEDAGLDDLLRSEKTLWKSLATEAYEYVSRALKDSGEPVRPDDLIPPLVPVLEVSSILREFLAENSLRQQYWYTWFGELIVDRLWDELQGGNE
jgi:hypothetical protein